MSPRNDVALIDRSISDAAEAPLSTMMSLTSEHASDPSPSSLTVAVDRTLSEDSLTFLERSRQPHDGE